MSDYQEGWAIRADNGVLWGHFSATRAAAIMNFMRNVSKEVYDEALAEAKDGRVFPRDTMTKTARNQWPKWRDGRGFMAVHVAMETVDYRISEAPPHDAP